MGQASSCFNDANRAIQRETGVNVMKLANQASQLYDSTPTNDGFFNNSSANSKELNGGPLVHTVEDFLALRDRLATTPQGGAVCFLHALLNWIDPQYTTVGEQMLVLSMFEENLVQGNTYKSFSLMRADLERLYRFAPPNEYIVKSYVAGTNPDNGYELLDNNVIIKFRPQDKMVGSIESGDYKVFIWSSGADTARPVKLKRNSKGLWKVNEFSSLTVAIRAPVENTGPTAADQL